MYYPGVVCSVRVMPELYAVDSEPSLEHFGWRGSKLTNGVDAKPGKLMLGRPAHIKEIGGRKGLHFLLKVIG